MITWTIGAGGLLGSAIRRQCDEAFSGSDIAWSEPDAAHLALRDDVRRFASEAADGPWALIWAAGAATVSTSPDCTSSELAALTSLLTDLRAHLPRGAGAVFVTSSAGGVYAGSADPPFDSATTPVPVSPYGELKLAQERTATELLAGVCPLVIGRISNLYGPGQNLAKLQGLISRLALAAATMHPVNIFVSLDTIRDYVYVDDAAGAVLRLVDDAARHQPVAPTCAIIASGEPTTIGQLIRTVNQVTKRKVPVALGSHASAAGQVADLRLVPSDPATARTPLPAGIRRVYLDILERLQERPITA